MSRQNYYRWFVLSIGVLAQAVFAMGFAGIPVTGILMRNAYHFNVYELGVVLGSMGLGVAISEIIWGILTDKLGDKTVLILGLGLSSTVFFCIACMWTPEASSHVYYLTLSVALMVAGVFGGSINSSSGRTVMSWFDDGERGFAMSIRQAAIPVGGAIGTALLPWLAYRYGFQIIFYVLAVIGLLVGAFVVFFIHSKHQFGAVKNTMNKVSSPLKSKDVWKLVLAAGFLTVPQMAVLTFGGIYMRDRLYLNLAYISIILIVIQLGGGILRIWCGRYTDKKKNRIPFLKFISVSCGGGSMCLAILANQEFFGVFLLIFTGLLGHAWHGVAYTETAVKAGLERAGTALGMIGTTVFLASFLTPIIVSNLLTSTNWNIVWGAVGLLTLMAFPFFGIRDDSKKTGGG